MNLTYDDQENGVNRMRNQVDWLFPGLKRLLDFGTDEIYVMLEPSDPDETLARGDRLAEYFGLSDEIMSYIAYDLEDEDLILSPPSRAMRALATLFDWCALHLESLEQE
jgi:hypothetical protein